MQTNQSHILIILQIESTLGTYIFYTKTAEPANVVAIKDTEKIAYDLLSDRSGGSEGQTMNIHR